MSSQPSKSQSAEVQIKGTSAAAANELSNAELDHVVGGQGSLSKMMSTLSNILKKISDTAQSITQNLK